MGNLTLLQEVLVWTVPILFAVTLHEVAHGWVASLLGDKTALILGRLSLNPLKHLDPIGSILVPLACLVFGGFVFGWAKPVPVDYRNLRQPQRDAALVAMAGPGANLVMAILWALIAKVGYMGLQAGYSHAVALTYMGQAGISINLLLMILNLVPIPPLDGSRVISSLLPKNLADIYARIEPYGFVILVALLVTNLLSTILGPPLAWLSRIFSSVFGLSA